MEFDNLARFEHIRTSMVFFVVSADGIFVKTIQSQLILAFSIAILVPAIVTMYVGMRIISDQTITRAETKTISDLNSAREIYRNKISEIHSVTRLTAVRSLVRSAVLTRDHKFLTKDLEGILQREKLVIL
jgi:hypothetical protein